MPKARRRTWLLAGAIAIFIGVMVAVPAFADQGTAGIPLPPPPPAGSGDNGGDGGSTAGYPNASPGQAENLFTNHFSDTVDSLASDPPDLSGEHPDFLDNHTAVVSPDGSSPAIADDIESILARDQHDVAAAQSDLSDLLGQQRDEGKGSPQLVSSVLPLRTNSGDGQALVDLSLDQQGSSYVPDNPLVDLKLPENLNNIVALGNDGIKVDVGATDSATADPTNGGNSLFYADAAPATDVVLAPIAPGLESFYQLRAPESPDHFRMDFTLPDGAQLTGDGEGGAQIVQANDVLGVVYPPSASDASGNAVNVSMSVAGDSLILDVPHSDPGIRYPISVDPVVDLYTWSTDGHGIFADWIANQATGSPYILRRTCKENVDCTSGTSGPTGLYSLAPPNQAIAQYAGAVWQYQVPHYPWTTAYVSVANLGPMYFNPRTDTNANPFMFAGIYPDASGSGYVDTEARTTAAGNLYWQLNAGSATTAKQVAFGLWSFVARTPTAWRDAYDGGAAIWLGDKESPTLTEVTHTGISIGPADGSYSNWVDNASPSVSVTATDNGLGIESIEVPDTESDSSVKSVPENCDGTSTSPCVQHPGQLAESYDTSQMDDGVTVTGIGATDALGKSVFRTMNLRVDHTPPSVDSVTGSLTQNAGAGPYTLHVDASDGDGTDNTGALWQSGVKSIEVDINSQQVANTGNQTCTSTEASCPLSLDYALDPQSVTTNELHIQVIATDELGHSHSTDWNTTITGASTQPTINVSGSLFDAPAGWVNQGATYNATATAQSSAGVTDLKMMVDDQEVDHVSQACAPGGCSLTHTFSIDPGTYQGGSHQVSITATDKNGATSHDNWTMNVDPSGTIGAGAAAATMAATDDPSASSDAVLEADTPADPSVEQPRFAQSGSSLASTDTEVDSQASLASTGFSLDLPAGQISASRLDTSSQTTPGLLTSDKARIAYANTSSATDSVLRPSALGMLAVEAVRQASAPGSFSWQLHLPSGDTISNPTAHDVVVRDSSGASELDVWIPYAVDAAGHRVPATLTLQGQTITLELNRSGTIVYPIVAPLRFLGAYQKTTTIPTNDPDGGTVYTTGAEAPVPELDASELAASEKGSSHVRYVHKEPLHGGMNSLVDGLWHAKWHGTFHWGMDTHKVLRPWKVWHTGADDRRTNCRDHDGTAVYDVSVQTCRWHHNYMFQHKSPGCGAHNLPACFIPGVIHFRENFTVTGTVPPGIHINDHKKNKADARSDGSWHSWSEN